jgi:murein DD-endopeptidase MepM/ murein hydrolase activator NlpD
MASNPGIDPYNLMPGQTICIPACPPNHSSKIIEPGDTLQQIAQTYHVSISSILEANPSVDPNSLRVGQRLCIPSACEAELSIYRNIIDAMQNDLNLLKQESQVQQTHQSNYGNSGRTTRALSVTESGIRFDAVQVTFPVDYRGRYTVGLSYPYYIDAAMGGQRALNVEDNFGIWHTFRFRENIQ